MVPNALTGKITFVTGSGNRSIISPMTVTTSLERATIVMTGRKVIVIVTPVSEAKYFEKVICEQMNQRQNIQVEHKRDKNSHEAFYIPNSARKLTEI